MSAYCFFVFLCVWCCRVTAAAVIVVVVVAVVLTELKKIKSVRFFFFFTVVVELYLGECPANEPAVEVCACTRPPRRLEGALEHAEGLERAAQTPPRRARAQVLPLVHFGCLDADSVENLSSSPQSLSLSNFKNPSFSLSLSVSKSRSILTK